MNYKPTADIEAAYLRAQLYADIHRFFAGRGVLQVDTPILSHAGATDVHLDSICTAHHVHGKPKTGYLHTSPEFAMKRLVAAWGEPIYQLCKVFRDGEVGARHNLEFTMLEWYRPEFTLAELADELAELLEVILNQSVVLNHLTYAQAFMDFADIEPFTVTIEELEQVAILHGIDTSLSGRIPKFLSVMADNETSKNGGGASVLEKSTAGYSYIEHANIVNLNNNELKQAWLDLLYSHLVEPNLGKDMPTLIFDFPASMASLARVHNNADGFKVAKRFELYINGLEIANAYEELTDATEQRKRFEADNAARTAKGIKTIPLDENLLAALDNMPDCSGIALGVDRLLMVLGRYEHIHEAIQFPIERL